MQKEDLRRSLMNQMIFLGEMASTETALFQQAAAAKYGLGITDMKTISVLMQEGPMTAGQIAKRLSLTTGAVTNVIDRLGRRDIVKREPDTKDRRKVIVAVNRPRIATMDNVYSSIGQAFEKMLEAYSTPELEFLTRYHRASIELTRREITKLNDYEVTS